MRDVRTEFSRYLSKWTRQAYSDNGSLSIIELSNELEALSRSIRPNYLYRFRDSERIETEIDNLRNGIVYLPAAQHFNDIQDSVIFIDENEMLRQIESQLTKERVLNMMDAHIAAATNLAIRARLKRLRRGLEEDFTSTYNQFCKIILEQRVEACHKYRNSFRIACFTEDYKDTTMWGIYAQCGRGYAVRYRVPKQLDVSCSCEDRCCVSGREILSLYPVLYDGQFDATPLSPVIMHEHHVPYIPSAVDLIVQVNALIHKSSNWSFEKEWRIVAPDCDSMARRADTNAMYANLLADRIYLGYAMSREDKARFVEFSRETSIPLFQAKEDNSSIRSAFTFTQIEL